LQNNAAESAIARRLLSQCHGLSYMRKVIHSLA
jgi:hypothetical protein